MISAPSVVASHNLELERGVLGAAFYAVEAVHALVEEDNGAALFYLERHRAVLAAFTELAPTLNGTPPDMALVHAVATRHGEVDFGVVSNLYEAGITVVDVRGHLRELRELAARREEHAATVMLHAAVARDAEADPTVWRAVRERLAVADTWRARSTDAARAPSAAYLEPLAAFLADDDPPHREIFPDVLPCGVIMLVHGEPRARKSLVAFEFALAAATGTAPFGLARFTPADPINVVYIQEEDPRALTKARLRRLVAERCGATMPTTLHLAVRRGVDLDDPAWIEQLIADCTRLDARLLVLDAARRLSTKTDEGPAKVRDLMAALRALVTRAGVTLVIVHHDVKPARDGQDARRRGQRASGGDWFAGCECPVHVERVDARESLVFPQDYKFAADPAPFTFTCQLDGRLIRRLVGRDTTSDDAEAAGARGKLVEWLRLHGPASKTALKEAGFGWETLQPLLDGLLRDGQIDAAPGRKKGSLRYFVVIPEPSPPSQDGSPLDAPDAP